MKIYLVFYFDFRKYHEEYIKTFGKKEDAERFIKTVKKDYYLDIVYCKWVDVN